MPEFHGLVCTEARTLHPQPSNLRVRSCVQPCVQTQVRHITRHLAQAVGVSADTQAAHRPLQRLLGDAVINCVAWHAIAYPQHPSTCPIPLAEQGGDSELR